MKLLKISAFRDPNLTVLTALFFNDQFMSSLWRVEQYNNSYSQVSQLFYSQFRTLSEYAQILYVISKRIFERVFQYNSHDSLLLLLSREIILKFYYRAQLKDYKLRLFMLTIGMRSVL